MTQAISTILFDVGGVIVVPLDPPATRRRRDRLAASIGFDSGEAMWNHFFESEVWNDAKTGRLVYDEMWENLLQPYGFTSPLQRNNFLADLYADEGMLPGMRSLVQTLHGSYSLGILSNWDDRLEEILEDKLDIAHYFDAILNSHRIGVAKPYPDAFQMALERLQVDPHQVLFIDDLSRNTDAAARMGFHTHIYRDLPTLVKDLQERGILDGEFEPPT